jgi:hypothetical protein
MAHLEGVTLSLEFGDTAAVAHPPIGLVTERIGGPRRRKLGNPPQVISFPRRRRELY